MDDLVTLDELDAFMAGAEFNFAQAALLLGVASGTVRDFTCQTLSLVEGDEIRLRGRWTSDFTLPQRPVLGVTSVSIDGVAVPAAGYDWDSDGRVTFRGCWPSGVVNAPTANVGYWGGDLLVDFVYDHGFDPVPPGVKGIVLDLARRAITTPDAGAVTQVSLGSFSESYARQAASTLTEGEIRKLRRYRRSSATLLVGA